MMPLWGSISIAIDIAIVMALVAAFGGSSNTVANGFGIFFLLLFGILFSLGWNSGCPMYCTEIFLTSIRATCGLGQDGLKQSCANADRRYYISHYYERRDRRLRLDFCSGKVKQILRRK
jgi:hypothetical protein